MSELRKKTIDGVFWSFVMQFSTQAVSLVVQIILARILLPEAFGLIAMIQIFVSIGQVLMDGGMTSSLIRTKEADQKDYSTVFFINLISSLVLYIILFFCTPFIASFYNQPILTSIIRVYTLAFIIQAFVSVQTTRLTKEMQFKTQMYMKIPSTIIGGIIGVIMAYQGYGVWSLVGLNLSSTFIFMLQHWFYSDWRPSFIIDKDKFKYHFNFGYKLTLSALLTNIYLNLYTLIIGKFFSVSQLGYYNQANTLRMYPVGNLTLILQKVTYPLFASIQDEDERLKSIFKRITKMVFFIITPIMMFLIVIAEPLFRFVLTEKWLPAVPYFQILCLVAIVYPQSMYNLNIIAAKGRSDLHFKMEVIKKTLSLLFLFLIFPFGIWGVIYAQALSMLLHAYVNALYTGRMINYSVKEQIIDITPIFFIGLTTLLLHVGIDLIFKTYTTLSDPSRIFIGFLIYFAIYLIICFALKVKTFFDVKDMIMSKMKLKK